MWKIGQIRRIYAQFTPPCFVASRRVERCEFVITRDSHGTFLHAVDICNTIGAYTWNVMGTTVPGEMSSYFYNHVQRRSQHARGYEDTRML